MQCFDVTYVPNDLQHPPSHYKASWQCRKLVFIPIENKNYEDQALITVPEAIVSNRQFTTKSLANSTACLNQRMLLTFPTKTQLNNKREYRSIVLINQTPLLWCWWKIRMTKVWRVDAHLLLWIRTEMKLRDAISARKQREKTLVSVVIHIGRPVFSHKVSWQCY